MCGMAFAVARIAFAEVLFVTRLDMVDLYRKTVQLASGRH